MLPQPAPAEQLSGDEQVWRALVLGTRDFVRKNGGAQAALGLSGGIDASVTAAVAVPVIASGGAGDPAHFAEAFEAGASAALAASVFHFGTLTVAAVKEACAARGFPMRR